MEFYEVINKRRTIRDWIDMEVSTEQIERIIDAGLAAPSNDHMRRWEFILLHTDEEKERALQFIAESSKKQTDSQYIPDDEKTQMCYGYAIPRQYAMFRNASFVIIPLFQTIHGIYNVTDLSGLNNFASIWCVIENILLSATAEGLGASLRIPTNEESENVRGLLNVPDHYVMPCYIGIGYPDENAKKIQQHIYHAKEKMHYGNW